MYAVDPIEPHGKSVVQTASFRWHDLFPRGGELGEGEGMIRSSGRKMWTIALALGRSVACTFSSRPNGYPKKEWKTAGGFEAVPQFLKGVI
jgi:hypothetical protein